MQNPSFSSSFNPLSSLSPSHLSYIHQSLPPFLSLSHHCLSFWNSLPSPLPFPQPLSLPHLTKLFHRHESTLYHLTNLSSIEQFILKFDTDKDGCLNEDQLISVFVEIKDRAVNIANNAIQIQEYGKFKDIMKEVRVVEGLITGWQDILRVRIDGKQLEQYREIGNVKIEEFCGKYQTLWKRMDDIKSERRWQLERRLTKQTQQLEIKLNDPLTLVKIKPNNKIKQLQLKEKLVCLQERVEEALNFRAELNKLEADEEIRLQQKIQKMSTHQRNLLKFNQEKEREQLENKLEQLEGKLLVQMSREYDTLVKRNKLHENQIKKIQAMARRVGLKKGAEEPERERTKEVERRKNALLSNYKKKNEVMTTLATETPELPRLSMKSGISFESTKFDLNVGDNKIRNRGQRVKTVHKYLQTSEKEKVYPLCDMYNKGLIEVSNPELRYQTRMSTITDSSRKKTILEKIKVEV